jgi:iron complex transport system substrate-binding protein
VNAADITLSSGAGMNPVSMEQVLLWQPDVILFAPGSTYENAATDPLWLKLNAMKEGRYYEIPGEPYNWLGRPPAVNRLLGVKWLGNLLYPDIYKYDMAAEAQKFFKLFYHYDFKLAAAEKLMAHSTFR